MTSGINFLGSYSGIDQSTVDSLMAVEKQPLIQMAEQKETYESKQNAWRDINTRLDSLMAKVRDLQLSSTYEGKTASSADSETVSAEAGSSAAAGTYEIAVERLATSARVIGTKLLAEGETNATELGIEGSLTIANADGIFETVVIEATDTLSTLAQKINGLQDSLGISATVIDGRMVLSDDQSGNRSITLSDSDGTTLAALGLDASDPEAVYSAGTTALFSVNGIAIERDSNSVSDAVEGLTLTLGSETASGESVKVDVNQDTQTTIDRVEAFIEQYNSTLAFLQEKSDAGDPETAGSAGALAGDPTLQRIISTLRTTVGGSLSGLDSDYTDASQLGVTTVDRYGQLQLNATTLTEALAEDPESVKNFFHDLDGDGTEIGLSARLETYLNSLLAAGTGIVEVREEGLGRSLETLGDRIEAFNDRMERREAYYIRMFTRLDVALQQAESQMSWLSSQLASLSGLSTGSES